MKHRAAVAVIAATAALITGCSSSSPAPAPSPVTSVGVAGPAAAGSTAVDIAATPWWSNEVSYCGLLKQTLAAGHSILPSAPADDPTLHAVTTAFVAKLKQTAPAEVAPSWQVLGNLINMLVQANGDPSAVHGVDTAKVKAAVATVSSDAQSRCGVSLSTAH